MPKQDYHKEELFDFFIGNCHGFLCKFKHEAPYQIWNVSKNCLELTAYQNNELELGKIIPYIDLILPKYQKDWLESRQIREDQKTGVLIYQIFDKMGQVKWVKEFYLHTAAHIESYIQDITPRKSNSPLSNEFASYQNAINSGSIVSITDKNGRIIFVNDLFCNISKYNRKELIGQSHAIVNSGYHDKAFFSNLWQTILKGDTWRAQIRNKDKFGKYYWVDTVITPVFGENGEIEQFLSIRNVITQQKENEYALIESEALNKSALATLKANIAVCDFEGIILKTNKNWEDFSSKNGEKDLSKTSVGANYFKVLEQAIAKGDEIAIQIKSGISDIMKHKISQFELDYPCHSDNKERWFHLHVSKFEKTSPRLLFCHYDITQKIQSEKANRNNQSRLLEAQRLAKIGSWELDILQNKLMWSDECYRIFEQKKIGSDVTYETFLNLVHPEDRDFVDSSYYNSIKNKQAYGIEHRLQFKNGKIKYVYEQCETFYNDEGMPIRSIGTTQDITKQKESEILLEDQNIRYQNVIENISDGLIIDNIKGKIIFANQQFLDLIGLPREELKKFNFYDHVLESFRLPMKLRHDLRVQGENVSETFEYQGKRRDGKIRWFEARVSKIYKNNQIVGTQSAIRDITDSKYGIELLKNSEAEKTNLLRELNNRYNELMQFNYIVSHNLRAPIANLLGLCDLFSDKTLEANEVQTVISHIQKSVVKIDDMISDLNLILSAQSNINSKKEEIDLEELIDRVTATLNNQIHSNGIELTVYIHENARNVHSIKSFLKSCIYNLISNAIKYRKNDNPKVHVEVERNEQEIKISVADNGIGLDLEKYGNEIFGLYKRFHPNFEGKGLGLHMSKTQIESLGGTLKIKSKPDHGSIFTIHLPT